MSKGGSGLFLKTKGIRANLGEDYLVVITPQGDKIIDFTTLPGSKGVRIPKRLTKNQMEHLTQQYGIEFAQIYELGPGKNGRGGKYVVYSGTIDSVVIPVTDKTILINHTHPNSTSHPSEKDKKLMQLISSVGSPQKTSEIIPIGKESIKFTKKGLKQ